MAALGFCLTGVGLPLLGIIAMAISESKGLFDMSLKVSRGFAYFFTVALYLTIGPLFAIPRTASVAFQVGVAPILRGGDDTVELLMFSLFFFAIVLLFSLHPSGIMTWIGKILNPAFLSLLSLLIIFAIASPMGSSMNVQPAGDYIMQPFFKGVFEGYNTMDALASLAFGIILIEVIQNLGIRRPEKISLAAVQSGVISMSVMAVIYCSLTIIGAESGNIIGISEDGGIALSQIAKYYFGLYGGLLFSVIVTVACIKTSLGLVTALSRTFSEMFPAFCTYNRCAVLFSLISLLIANAGLNTIISVSIPVLIFLYPLTIVLIALCICGRCFNYDKTVFIWTMGATVITALLELSSILPSGLKSALPLLGQLVSLASVLPLADVGMGWLSPVVIVFMLSLLGRFLGNRAGNW